MAKKTAFTILIFTLAVSSVIWSGIVLAEGPDLTRKLTQVSPLEGRAGVAIPAKAIEVAPGVFNLGVSWDKNSGREVEGYAFIHYKDSKIKPAGAGKGKPAPCYGYLAKGAKWKAVEPWIVNATNTRGLAEDFILADLGYDINKWEDAADGAIDGRVSKNILGEGAATTSLLIADTISPDGANEVYFANIEDSGAIAITIVWGIFGGPAARRELVEWDQIYDDYDFDWSAGGEAGKMDFENIATHELGHSAGMGDLYEGGCSEQTMYGYASNGETKKRTLESGDIAGIDLLY